MNINKPRIVSLVTLTSTGEKVYFVTIADGLKAIHVRDHRAYAGSGTWSGIFVFNAKFFQMGPKITNVDPRMRSYQLAAEYLEKNPQKFR